MKDPCYKEWKLKEIKGNRPLDLTFMVFCLKSQESGEMFLGYEITASDVPKIVTAKLKPNTKVV